MNKTSRVALMLSMCLLTLCQGAPADEAAVQRRLLWVWLSNLKGQWKSFIDFASEWRCSGVIIWGLNAWDDDTLCREICAYAHERKVDVIHGFGLNGYREGQHICKTVPEARATIPEEFHSHKKGQWSLKAIYCPFNEAARARIHEMLLKAADAGIDGFNFETADVDYITCHCSRCERYFKNQKEDASSNKPIDWPIMHTNDAVGFLSKERPKLWLSAEYCVQRFGKKPYTDSPLLERLATKIDRRCCVIWCEGAAPPQEIAEKMMRLRPNSGYFIRSGAILGLENAKKHPWEDELQAMKRLVPLRPKCMAYRSGIPQDYLAAKMAIAAEAMFNPTRPDSFFKQISDKVMSEAGAGGKYETRVQ